MFGTPLHSAVSKNAKDSVKILCQNGADLNLKNKDNFNPLSWAIVNNAWESVEILCQYGAKIN